MKNFKVYAGLALTSLLAAGTAGAQDVYRAIMSGEVVFETTDYNEASRFNSQGQVGLAWRSEQNIPGVTVPVYRCLVPQNGGLHHFSSRDPNCEGQRNEGIYGYVYPTAAPGRYMLFRAYAHPNNVGGSSHATLTSYPVGWGAYGFWRNYVTEGILGYVTTNYQTY